MFLIFIFEVNKVFEYLTITFETISLLAFCISWLIKGMALGDKGKWGYKLYIEDNPKKRTEKRLLKDVLQMLCKNETEKA